MTGESRGGADGLDDLAVRRCASFIALLQLSSLGISDDSDIEEHRAISRRFTSPATPGKDATETFAAGVLLERRGNIRAATIAYLLAEGRGSDAAGARLDMLRAKDAPANPNVRVIAARPGVHLRLVAGGRAADGRPRGDG